MKRFVLRGIGDENTKTGGKLGWTDETLTLRNIQAPSALASTGTPFER